MKKGIGCNFNHGTAAEHRPRTVTIVGAHPPKVGGVSIHVQRLAALLDESGSHVTVLDPYTRRIGPSEGLSYKVCGRVGLLGRLALLRDLFFQSPDVFHLHLSHGGNVVATLLLLTTAVRSRRIVTIHSGSFPAQLEEHSGLRRMLLRQAFRRCRSIICVSERLKKALIASYSELEARTVVLPAFLPAPEVSPNAPSPDGRPRVMAAGYGTPTYDWHTLLDGLGDCLHEIDLHLVFYTTYAEDYFPGLLRRIESYGSGITVHRDLSQEQFGALLASARVFVRPTLTDGDSIAVREALTLGVEVVASDASPRPLACRLFPVGQSAKLREEVRSALAAPVKGRTDVSQIRKDYLAIYGSSSAERRGDYLPLRDFPS